MTFFEKELQKIVADTCPAATYVGRACYIELPDSNRAKIEFIDHQVKDNYSALGITIINRKEGKVDNLTLRFKDILGVKQVGNPNFKNGIVPYIWDYKGQPDWYVYHPVKEDYKKLGDSLFSYLKVFDFQKDRKPSLESKLAEISAQTKNAGNTVTHDLPKER